MILALCRLALMMSAIMIRPAMMMMSKRGL
jgi:hypothetical protein